MPSCGDVTLAGLCAKAEADGQPVHSAAVIAKAGVSRGNLRAAVRAGEMMPDKVSRWLGLDWKNRLGEFLGRGTPRTHVERREHLIRHGPTRRCRARNPRIITKHDRRF
jgi:hypothetical protein